MATDPERPETESDLPPLHLGEQTSDSEPSGHDPDGRFRLGDLDWRRFAVIGAFVAAAVVATAIVADMRHDARDEAAAAEEVNLVLGGFENDRLAVTPSGNLAGRVHVFNAGERDVDVLSLYPTDWRDLPTDLGAQTVPAGDWVRVQVRAAPPCDTESSRARLDFRAVVRTDAGERTVTVPLSAGNVTELNLNAGILCATQPAQASLYVGNVDVGETAVGEVEGEVVAMRLMLITDTNTTRIADMISVTAVDTTALGFAVEASGLPVEVPLGGESNLDLTWSVTDCERAANVENAQIRFDHDVNPELLVTSQPHTLSSDVIASLGQLVDVACGA